MTATTAPDAASLAFEPEAALSHALLDATGEVDLAQRIEAGLYAARLLALGEHPGMSTEELEWLASDGQLARDLFIKSNLRLAISTARKFRHRGYTEDDVIQDAYYGLAKAVERYDYAKGFRFSTYAVWWIRESILVGIRHARFVKQPEHVWNKTTKIRAVQARLLDENGCPPTEADIAAQTGLSPGEVSKFLKDDVPLAYLHTTVGEDGMTLGDLIYDESDHAALTAIEDGLDRASLARIIRSALAKFGPVTTYVLFARYGLDGCAPRSVTELSEELGLNRQTIRARERKAMTALQQTEIAAILGEYRATVA